MADENIDRRIVEKLREAGHSVCYVADEAPGISDEIVLGLAAADNAILITSDKEFGGLFLRRHSELSGVLLPRLAGLGWERTASRVLRAVGKHERELFGAVTVVTRRSVRVRMRVRKGP